MYACRQLFVALLATVLAFLYCIFGWTTPLKHRPYNTWTIYYSLHTVGLLNCQNIDIYYMWKPNNEHCARVSRFPAVCHSASLWAYWRFFPGLSDMGNLPLEKKEKGKKKFLLVPRKTCKMMGQWQLLGVEDVWQEKRTLLKDQHAGSALLLTSRRRRRVLKEASSCQHIFWITLV